MSHLQATSSFPYTESSKREELFEPTTRYLLLLSSQGDETINSSLNPSTSGSSSRSGSSEEKVIMPGALPSTTTKSESVSKSTSTGKGKGRSKTKGEGKGKGKSDLPEIDFDLDQLLGFSSFRFDTEETLSTRDAEVVYCYEVQLSPKARGLGLGKLLIDHLEEVGKRREMDKVMLTCLKSNTTALNFYTKHGYTPDEIDPTRMAEDEEYDSESEEDGGTDEEDSEVDYVILSKDLRGKRRTV
nr:uncharacterized protein CI109_000217 [Kwoniella shandongensis]KAA5531376.1 hypothetical protein CI109_000217 [Kwoniella shandongensis]